MFICGTCQKQQPVSTQPIRVVTKIRIKEYNNGSRGRETVKEVLSCRECAAENRVPEVVHTPSGVDATR